MSGVSTELKIPNTKYWMMGQLREHPPVLLITAVITRYEAALAWAKERYTSAWGPIAFESPTFAVTETDYYAPTMGEHLGKTFFAFDGVYDPGEIATTKHQTNAWEAEYAALARHPEPRPLNLDPGYLTAAKLVLSSTKDHAHRIYVGQNMFAEITLFYRRGAWQAHEFTFPDYRRADYHAFFDRCREHLKSRGSAGRN